MAPVRSSVCRTVLLIESRIWDHARVAEAVRRAGYLPCSVPTPRRAEHHLARPEESPCALVLGAGKDLDAARTSIATARTLRPELPILCVCVDAAGARELGDRLLASVGLRERTRIVVGVEPGTIAEALAQLVASDEIEQAAAGTASETQDRRQGLTDTARQRHDALTDAIQELERALAETAASGAQRWSERVAQEVRQVVDRIRDHVDGVEEPSGVFDEIRAGEPWLVPRVTALQREHRRMIEHANRLAEKLPTDARADVAGVREEAAVLLALLREHRVTEAELIYEAFWTDLGAGD